MKRLLQNLFLGGLGAGLMLACSVDNVEDEIQAVNATTTQVQVEDVTMNDLVGKWTMHSMTSVGKAVDFDQNGESTFDLLEETGCFRNMYFDFDAEGKVTTEQARLFFDGSTGKFSCQEPGVYTATYQVAGNDVKFTFKVDELEYTETREITRYSENGAEYLQFILLKSEVDAAVYVANDPGNTVASGITEIKIVYTKE